MRQDMSSESMLYNIENDGRILNSKITMIDIDR